MDKGVTIAPGADIYGSDGDKVGMIREVVGGYAVVEKGFFFPKDYYIPISAIDNADEDGNLYLAVTKDEALHQGWDAVPDLGALSTAEGGAGLATNAGAGAASEVVAADYVAETGVTGAGSEAVRVPVYEEEIVPIKREVDRGAVRIEKELVTEERTVTVPVTEERVRVTRVAADEAVPAGAAAFEEGVIEVPLRGEEVDVQTTARQTGEVVVEKEAVAREERVGGTVRREEVRVEDRTIATDADADVASRG